VVLTGGQSAVENKQTAHSFFGEVAPHDLIFPSSEILSLCCVWMYIIAKRERCGIAREKAWIRNTRPVSFSYLDPLQKTSFDCKRPMAWNAARGGDSAG
jgi:hypothetical protein